MMQRIIGISKLSLLIVILSVVALGQSGGNVQITGGTVEGSGHVMSGGNFVVEVRAGQGIAGGRMSGQGFDVANGFWSIIAPQPPVTLPAAPGSLTALAVSTTQIDLAWMDNSDNEDGFVIERCQGNGRCRTFVVIAQVGVGVVQYSDTGLERATNYTYRIFAFNGAGESTYSNLARTKTLRR